MLLKVFVSVALIAVTVTVAGPVPVKEPQEHDIIKLNENVLGGLFEGDIEGVNPNTRNAIRDKTQRFALPIPYNISEQYGWKLTKDMKFALSEFSVRTCVEFRPAVPEDDTYVFYTRGTGCSSGVGTQGPGVHQVTLSIGCESNSTTLHETMHRIGFWHEQSRTDRDEYVQIVWDNISPNMQYNFDKYDSTKIDDLGLAYDYESVLHYSDTAFTMYKDEKTILPTAAHSDVTKIGKGEDFTKLDIAKINKLYECSMEYDAEGKTKWTEWCDCDLSCKQYRTRWCDDDACETWGAKEQEERACTDCTVNVNKDCDAKFIKAPNTITSPLFPYWYSNNFDSYETITAPQGETLTLHFAMMDVEFGISEEKQVCVAGWDYLKIYDGPDQTSKSVLKVCGNNFLPEPIKSTGNSLTVHLHSDGSNGRGGFLAHWFTESSALLHMCNFESGSLESCGWTSLLETESDQTWTYRAKLGSTPSLETGPDGDATLDQYTEVSTKLGCYIYLESSAPVVTGAKAQTLTPAFIGTSTGECLKFSYNMYGSSMGSLNVYWVPTNGESEQLFTLSGDQGKEWQVQTIGIPPSKVEYKIMFEAIRGTSWTGDVAIDDVFLNKGTC